MITVIKIIGITAVIVVYRLRIWAAKTRGVELSYGFYTRWHRLYNRLDEI